MSEFRVSRDSNSGALLLERNLASYERRTVRLTLTFRPVGLMRKILCWFGLDFPGPVLSEIVINDIRVRLIERRVITRTKVLEEIIAILDPGKGIVKIVLGPEDYQGRWKVTFKIEPLYN